MSIHEFHSRVRYSECGEDGRLTLNSVVNYFQDVSSFQGEAGGIGIDFLKKNHLAWLLNSWQILTYTWPKLGEEITAQTWAYDFQSFYGMRNFALRDAQGNACAIANSVWVLLDTESQRPVKVLDRMRKIYGLSPKLEMEYAPRKVPEPKGGEKMPAFCVEQHHLDTNHHVNNAQFIEMARTYLPPDFAIRETRIEYRRQAHLHDRIEPVVSRESEHVYTVALHAEDGNSFATARFASAGGK